MSNQLADLLKSTIVGGKYLDFSRPVWIYGAGNVGRETLGILVNRGFDVKGFIDKNASPDRNLNGVPVVNIESAEALDVIKDSQVVIAIFNAFVEIPPIVAQLRAIGFEKVITFLQLHDEFADDFGDRYWLTSRRFYIGQAELIARGYNLWADEKSRLLYDRILRFRLEMDYSLLPTPEWHCQYFPTDIPGWEKPLRIVDCGAFDGDTLKNAMAAGYQISAAAAFEPDQENFIRLSTFVAQNTEQVLESVSLFPCGVDASTKQFRFNAGHGAGSHASASGNSVIQCVSIDEALPKFNPNLIKMDIEGAEYAALRGATRTIKAYHPGLAICVYHCPAHLWQIPILIEQLTGSRGKLYLRSHCASGFDLVAYWHPM